MKIKNILKHYKNLIGDKIHEIQIKFAEGLTATIDSTNTTLIGVEEKNLEDQFNHAIEKQVKLTVSKYDGETLIKDTKNIMNVELRYIEQNDNVNITSFLSSLLRQENGIKNNEEVKVYNHLKKIIAVIENKRISIDLNNLVQEDLACNLLVYRPENNLIYSLIEE